jgi:hypothetical protein
MFRAFVLMLILSWPGFSWSADNHFSHSFNQVGDSNANDFLYQQSNARKYVDWTGESLVSYWGPSENSVIAKLTYRFPFRAASKEIRVKASLASFNFSNGGGQGKGQSSLWGSKDGNTWLPLLDAPIPKGMDSYKAYDDAIPAELLGTNVFYLEVRMKVENTPTDTYATAQFSRNNADSESPIFSIIAKLEDEEVRDPQPIKKIYPRPFSPKPPLFLLSKGVDIRFYVNRVDSTTLRIDGMTNFPANTRVVAELKSPDGKKCFADKVSVRKDGYILGVFKNVTDGYYCAGIRLSDPSDQPDPVLQVIGVKGNHLKGSLVQSIENVPTAGRGINLAVSDGFITLGDLVRFPQSADSKNRSYNDLSHDLAVKKAMYRRLLGEWNSDNRDAHLEWNTFLTAFATKQGMTPGHLLAVVYQANAENWLGQDKVQQRIAEQQFELEQRLAEATRRMREREEWEEPVDSDNFGYYGTEEELEMARAAVRKANELNGIPCTEQQIEQQAREAMREWHNGLKQFFEE